MHGTSETSTTQQVHFAKHAAQAPDMGFHVIPSRTLTPLIPCSDGIVGAEITRAASGDPPTAVPGRLARLPQLDLIRARLLFA